MIVGKFGRSKSSSFIVMKDEVGPTGEGKPKERSKARWRNAAPNRTLTWGARLSGGAFVRKAESYGAYGPGKTILEVGPGYGRLFRECLRRELEFHRYVAIDISEKNVEYLRRELGRDDTEVILGDIESVSFDQTFDSVLSSLTFKHLYPSFEQALRNIERHLNPGSTVIFDLVEGDQALFEPAGSYNRAYSRTEVSQILRDCSLELVTFDEVQHHPDFTRLLVVARRL
jgi:SAM-dependent methyltransferase